MTSLSLLAGRTVNGMNKDKQTMTLMKICMFTKKNQTEHIIYTGSKDEKSLFVVATFKETKSATMNIFRKKIFSF